MYPTATDDTQLHLGYEALTPLELDLPFALTIFTLIQSNEFLALLNLANTPENFVKVVGRSDRPRRLPHPQPAHPLQRLA